MTSWLSDHQQTGHQTALASHQMDPQQQVSVWYMYPVNSASLHDFLTTPATERSSQKMGLCMSTLLGLLA